MAPPPVQKRNSKGSLAAKEVRETSPSFFLHPLALATARLHAARAARLHVRPPASRERR